MQVIDWAAIRAKRNKKAAKKARKKSAVAQPAPKRPALKPRDGFYGSREWAALRYQALLKNNGKCELCGRSKHDGVILHVDHIKPRSKHPKLELVLSNLQVLCATCNRGKSNKDDTDWRDILPSANDEWSAVRERLGES